MKTIKTVQTSRAGTVEVACDDPRGWEFGVSASVEDGRDVVAVRLWRADDAPPPAFEVRFRVPGAGIQNVWSCSHEARGDGRHYLASIWWEWLVKQESSIAHDIPLLAGFNSAGVSPLAFACSEAFERLEFGLGCEERTCDATRRARRVCSPNCPRRRRRSNSSTSSAKRPAKRRPPVSSASPFPHRGTHGSRDSEHARSLLEPRS